MFYLQGGLKIFADLNFQNKITIPYTGYFICNHVEFGHIFLMLAPLGWGGGINKFFHNQWMVDFFFTLPTTLSRPPSCQAY